MVYNITHPTKTLKGEITLTSSKSESNRVLIIQALCKEEFNIINLAKAEDTVTLNTILDNIDGGSFDVGAAGTTMRFLTGYLSTLEGTHILSGSERMHKRPIGILVDALRSLGGDIEYMEGEGFPPLKITGKELDGGEITVDGGISSQYISALMLIAPNLKDGLVLRFAGEVTSKPYIDMTANMMKEFGVEVTYYENCIKIGRQEYVAKDYEVEGDWSSASYLYGMSALADEVDLTIHGLKKNSLQGDSEVANIFYHYGIKTKYEDGKIKLSKSGGRIGYKHWYHAGDYPDLVQTITVTSLPLEVQLGFKGVHTLKIKETDRVLALKDELEKLGSILTIIDDDNIEILTVPPVPVTIKTYDDHRMAMAFSILGMSGEVNIEDPEVVGKSYPDFWEDLKTLGFIIKNK